MDKPDSERHLTDAELFALAAPPTGEPEALPRHLSQCQACSRAPPGVEGRRAGPRGRGGRRDRPPPAGRVAGRGGGDDGGHPAGRPAGRAEPIPSRWAVGIAASLLVARARGPGRRGLRDRAARRRRPRRADAFGGRPRRRRTASARTSVPRRGRRRRRRVRHGGSPVKKTVAIVRGVLWARWSRTALGQQALAEGKWWKRPRIAQALALTPAQTTELEKIFAKSQPEADRPEGRPREEAVRLRAGDAAPTRSTARSSRRRSRRASRRARSLQKELALDGARHEAGADARAAREGDAAARSRSVRRWRSAAAACARGTTFRTSRRRRPAGTPAQAAAGSRDPVRTYSPRLIRQRRDALPASRSGSRNRSSRHGSPRMWYPFSSQNPAPVLAHELEAARPLGALPEVEVRDHDAHRRAVLGASAAGPSGAWRAGSPRGRSPRGGRWSSSRRPRARRRTGPRASGGRSSGPRARARPPSRCRASSSA